MPQYAYCRVSTREQNLERQHDAVRERYPDLPPENFIDEKRSGKDFERTKYRELKKQLRPGDELIIKEVDRLGRNKRLVERERAWMENNGVTLRVLEIPQTLVNYGEDGPDTETRMIIDIQFLLKEYQAERELEKIHKRQQEGVQAAIASGKINAGGRPPIPTDTEAFLMAARRYRQHYTTLPKFLEETGLTESTAYRRLRKLKADPELFRQLVTPLSHAELFPKAP